MNTYDDLRQAFAELAFSYDLVKTADLANSKTIVIALDYLESDCEKLAAIAHALRLQVKVEHGEQQTAFDYLPVYNNLDNATRALSDYVHGKDNNVLVMRVYRLLYKKLINKTCGIVSPEQKLSANTWAHFINVTKAVIAAITQGIEAKADERTIYQQAKAAVAAVTYTGHALGHPTDSALTHVDFKTEGAV